MERCARGADATRRCGIAARRGDQLLGAIGARGGRADRLALDELAVAPGRCLFVAGSAYDLVGTAAVGLPTYWHDRIGMTPPDGAPSPLAHHATLRPLLAVVGVG